MTAKKFKNFTDKDFTYSFDSVPYTFKAGQEIFLEDYKADHFAKHLVDREMNKLGQITSNQKQREALLVQCFPTDEAVSVAEALNIEETKKEKGKKGKKKVEETEFPDLN